MTKSLLHQRKFIPLFFLLMCFSALAQKPTYTFTFKVYINEATAQYYGGHAAIESQIASQFAAVNQFYNNTAGFTANYNFTPSVYSYFTETNPNTQDVLNGIAFSAAETSYNYRILYSRDPKGGSHPNIIGDFTVDTRSIRFCLNAEAEWGQSLFGTIPTRILMHELGHARGALDLYAGKVVASKNQIWNDVSYEYPGLSIMNNLYDLSAGFDAHSINFINASGTTLHTGSTWRTLFWSKFPNAYSIRVRDQSGNPIQNAKVTLYGVRWLSEGINSSDAFVYYTNAQGKVTFDGTTIAASPYQDQGGSASFFSNFMVVAEYGGSGQYNWMPVYDVQLAKINNQSEYLLDYSFTVSNPAPNTSIIAPANNASFTAPASVTINANASDNGSISKVEFYHGSTLLNTDNTSPYSFTWNNVAAGTYALTVKAYDNLNAVTTSSVVNIAVNPTGGCTDPLWDAGTAYSAGAKVSYNGRKYTANYWTMNNRPDLNCCAAGEEWTDNGACGGTNVAPTTSITSPANNTTFAAPASVTINANANDADGSISKVEFYRGTTLLNTDNTSPYSYTWTNVSAGTYALTVKAYDNLNAVTTSSVVNITVNGNSAPTTSITSPSNNATFAAPASVTINANASDADGTISKVEFYKGSTLLNTDNASPYSYLWTGVAAGTYTITVKAYDNLNAVTTSSAVTIVVTSGGGCSSQQWTAGNASYANGTVVKNTVGGVVKKFQCTVSGWCQSSSAFYYEPGNGTAWTSCWTELGVCNSRVGNNDELLDETEAYTLSLYPNPANDMVSIQGNAGSASIVRITVLNSVGNEMFTKEVPATNGIYTSSIELQGLPEGVYTLRASYEGGSQYKIFVKN